MRVVASVHVLRAVQSTGQRRRHGHHTFIRGRGVGRTFYLQLSLRLLTFAPRMISLSIRFVGSRSGGRVFLSLCVFHSYGSKRRKNQISTAVILPDTVRNLLSVCPAKSRPSVVTKASIYTYNLPHFYHTHILSMYTPTIVPMSQGVKFPTPEGLQKNARTSLYGSEQPMQFSRRMNNELLTLRDKGQ